VICNKCKKEIANNSKKCSYCGNIIEKKMKLNKKIVMWISIPILVVVALVIVLSVIKKEELYSLSDLKFLKQVNTSEIFTTLGSEVNSELNGTYAIVVSQNHLEDTYNIIALKEDNTMVKIATTEYSTWKNGIINLFYSNGKIYYAYADDTIWSIDLTEGNGNYKLKEYDFLEGYLDYNAWFYIIGNKIYYFDVYALYGCDLTTEKCEEQVIDLNQGFDMEIDNKKINVDFDRVYIENDKFIYVLSDDGENIYKIDINNPTNDYDLLLASYTQVDEVGKNAHLLSELSKLKIDEIEFDYEYNKSLDFFIVYQNRRYDLKNNNYVPITLLPNNYLMVEYYANENLFFGETKYINLKTGLIDENYSLKYESYYDNEIYFIIK